MFTSPKMTWTVLICICPKFVNRNVFSHSSTEEGDLPVYALPKNL